MDNPPDLGCPRCLGLTLFLTTLSYAIGLTANEMKDGKFLEEKIRYHFWSLVQKENEQLSQISREDIAKLLDTFLSARDVHNYHILMDSFRPKGDPEISN